jgi:hypothetical protein
VAALGILAATFVTGLFDAVLLLAPPTLFVFAALGALQEESSANAVKSHFEDKDPKIASAALSAAAAGKMRSNELLG